MEFVGIFQSRTIHPSISFDSLRTLCSLPSLLLIHNDSDVASPYLTACIHRCLSVSCFLSTSLPEVELTLVVFVVRTILNCFLHRGLNTKICLHHPTSKTTATGRSFTTTIMTMTKMARQKKSLAEGGSLLRERCPYQRPCVSCLTTRLRYQQ